MDMIKGQNIESNDKVVSENTKSNNGMRTRRGKPDL